MANNRLIELAIKGLEAERARLDQELADLRRQGKGSARSSGSTHIRGGSVSSSSKKSTPKRGGLTPEGRKKLSELAKKRWAANRKTGKTTL